MKSVSIGDLKRNLSELISEASQGERILITRHRRPVAALLAADFEHLHVGRRFGEGRLRPALQQASRGAYLQTLLEDREGGSER